MPDGGETRLEDRVEQHALRDLALGQALAGQSREGLQVGCRLLEQREVGLILLGMAYFGYLMIFNRRVLDTEPGENAAFDD